eukprot:CAMPEP_0114548900 /NCGR_PEP_ID=MMETSP0114-20121206/5236_1 /TAXON_ID=31324 /ORGANISM="Goniomonas sp, Strain m" /LENGTH=156 /DNA_ID=CAMNT_0001733537 /DNA_START=1 /DNA_END=467 /DNA_ORIENTATION=-
MPMVKNAARLVPRLGASRHWVTGHNFVAPRNVMVTRWARSGLAFRHFSEEVEVPPKMGIMFTCNKCETRAMKVFAKRSYEKGTVLISCPGCKEKHLIVDNLGLFGDDKFNLEVALLARGEQVVRGVVTKASTIQEQSTIMGGGLSTDMLIQELDGT